MGVDPITAGIMVGGSLLGGALADRGSRKAADRQQAGIQQQNAINQQAIQQQQALIRSGLAQQQGLISRGTQNQDRLLLGGREDQNRILLGGLNAQDKLLQQGLTQQQNVLKAGQRDATQEMRNAVAAYQQYQQPYEQAGQAALNPLVAAVTGTDNYEDPLLALAQEQAAQRIMQNSALSGRFGAGEMPGLMAQAMVNPAIEARQQRINNLINLAGMGQQSAGAMGQAGMAGGQNIASNMMNTATNRANVYGQVAGNRANVYGDTALNRANVYGTTAANRAQVFANQANQMSNNLFTANDTQARLLGASASSAGAAAQNIGNINAQSTLARYGAYQNAISGIGSGLSGMFNQSTGTNPMWSNQASYLNPMGTAPNSGGMPNYLLPRG